MASRSPWLAVVLAAIPLAAHHSTAAFDKTKTVPLVGTIAEITWMNPHAQMSLDVKNSSGETERWIIELPSPLVLTNRGWKRNDVSTGDQIAIDGWLQKTGAARAVARRAHLPGGRTISTLTAWDCASAEQEGCAGAFQLGPDIR